MDFSIAKKFRQEKYLITDKGTEYMRCAVKTTLLLNVLHLSLPDNLLGVVDMKIISNMISKNPPLRILNLSQNNFDFECTFIMGDALISNTRLKSLDLSNNRLGDLGVRNLLKPMISLALHQEGDLDDSD